MTGEEWDIIESKMSIIVPRGQINPQKNLPKTSVPIIKKIDNRAAVITARYAILVIIRINGSNRKKRFWSLAGLPYLVWVKKKMNSTRKKICINHLRV
jgi:hypothetical protein